MPPKSHPRALVVQAALSESRQMLGHTLRYLAEFPDCYDACPLHQEKLELLIELLEREAATPAAQAGLVARVAAETVNRLEAQVAELLPWAKSGVAASGEVEMVNRIAAGEFGP